MLNTFTGGALLALAIVSGSMVTMFLLQQVIGADLGVATIIIGLAVGIGGTVGAVRGRRMRGRSQL